MRDVQAEKDIRGKVIHKVGVRKVPALVKFKGERIWAEVSSYVTLPSLERGAHMSRFIEAQDSVGQVITDPIAYLQNFLNRLKEVHEAEEVFLKVRVGLPLYSISPIMALNSVRQIPCELEGRLTPKGYEYFIRVKMHVTTLCPCSKEISDRGAHNQKARINVRAQIVDNIDMTTFMNTLSVLGSSPIYELLKRPDEKFVTEAAYDNPKFCEDVARDTALALDEIIMITNYSIVVESFESIHDHAALAIIDNFAF